MADIQVKRAVSSSKGLSLRERYALLCYYYPQYNLKDAQEMTARDLSLLIRTAQRQEATKMYDMVLAVAAPHSSDKHQVKKLLEHYKKIIKE